MFYKIDVNWLRSEARRLVKEYWNLDEIPIIVVDETTDEEWNKENPQTLAIYYSKTMIIEFNSNMNKNRSKTELRKILLHKLCRWYLHKQGLPYQTRFTISELIKVRAGNTCNSDKKEIKKQRETGIFELRDTSYDFDIKLRHHNPNKTRNDFRRDIKETLIRFYNDNQLNDFEEYVGFSVEDIAHMMCEWYGYEIVQESIIDSFDFNGSCFGDIGERKTVIKNLIKLGLDEDDINKILL